jgi:hypothetical protein
LVRQSRAAANDLCELRRQAVMAPSCLSECPLSRRVSGAERTCRGHR